MSNTHDVNGAQRDHSRRSGTLLFAALALLTFTSTAGIVTTTLHQVEKRLDEPIKETGSLDDEDSRGGTDQ